MKDETRRMLLKRQTECKQKLERVQVRYGLDEISDEVYQTTLRHLTTEMAEISRGLEEANKNLSNMSKYIDEAVAMSCKLGTLWNSGNFENRQSLQKLIFPAGVLFDKENDDYRTKNENEVFKIFHRLSASYEEEKQKRQPKLFDCRLVSDNGDPNDPESLSRPERRAYYGKALVVVRGDRQPGTLTLRAEAEGLPEATLRIAVD